VVATSNPDFDENPPISYLDPAMSTARRTLVRAVEWATGQRQLKSVYDNFRAEGGTEDVFWVEMMRRTGIRLELNPGALGNIPKEGPLLVVANHPYGLVDGFALCWLVSQVRRDFQLLINSVLVQVPETRRVMLPIDFSNSREAQAINVATRMAARRHLDAGGTVLVFPAGGISTSPDRLGRRPAMDAPWQPFVAQLLQRSRCPVVPIYFHGQNSRIFQMVSHVSSTLRLALMAGEIRRRFGMRLGAVVGKPIEFSEVSAISDRGALSAELCRRTYALGGVDSTRAGMIVEWPRALQAKPGPKPAQRMHRLGKAWHVGTRRPSLPGQSGRSGAPRP
jgi:putative hemolysin